MVAFSVQMLPSDNSQSKDESSLWVNPSITKGSMIRWKVTPSWPCTFISSSNFQLREAPASAHKACGDLLRASVRQSVSPSKESESTALLNNGIVQPLWVCWDISARTNQPRPLWLCFCLFHQVYLLSRCSWCSCVLAGSSLRLPQWGRKDRSRTDAFPKHSRSCGTSLNRCQR